jgi:hypothetical protein
MGVTMPEDGLPILPDEYDLWCGLLLAIFPGISYGEAKTGADRITRSLIYSARPVTMTSLGYKRRCREMSESLKGFEPGPRNVFGGGPAD